MPDYTEAQIRELTGRELRVAVSLLVLGDDLTANTDERIEKAIASGWHKLGWKWNGNVYAACDVPWICEGNIWNDRGNEPYGSDLEQHVANWRAEPLPMPLEWCVPELMHDRWALRLSNGEWFCSTPCGVTGISDDPATAILRAACIVRLRETD